ERRVLVFHFPRRRSLPLDERRAAGRRRRPMAVDADIASLGGRGGVGVAGRAARPRRRAGGRGARTRKAGDVRRSRRRATGLRGEVYTPAAVTLAELASRLDCRLDGDGAIEITG